MSGRIGAMGTPARDWFFFGREHVFFAAEPDLHRGSQRALALPSLPPTVRARVAVVGRSPASADAHVAKLEALANDALGRMTGALFRGRIAELAVDLYPDEQVQHLSDGKLDRVNGLVVLTDRRLLFLGEAIRRAKRREEMIPIERIRGQNARSGCAPVARRHGRRRPRDRAADGASGRAAARRRAAALTAPTNAALRAVVRVRPVVDAISITRKDCRYFTSPSRSRSQFPRRSPLRALSAR